MLTSEMARANDVARSLPGGAGVREFAAREFPREDYHWVVRQLTRPTAAPAARPGLRARIRRWLDPSGKVAGDPAASPESPAA
jgi:hypothetical protein